MKMTGVASAAPHPNDDVDRLVRAARDGDVRAFTRLVEMQYPFVFRTAFRWLGNRSDAEDVAQTVPPSRDQTSRTFTRGCQRSV